MSDNSQDDDYQAPTPLIEDNNDDDEPPAAGACVVTVETPTMTVSTAPSAEPENRSRPKIPVTA